MSAAKNYSSQNFDNLQEKISIIQKIYTEKITALASAGKISEMQQAMKELQEKIMSVQNSTEPEPVPTPVALQEEKLNLPEIDCPVVKLVQLKVDEPEPAPAPHAYVPDEFLVSSAALSPEVALDPAPATYVPESFEEVTSPHLKLPAVEEASELFNYSHPMSDYDLNALVFKNERDCFEKLIGDPHFIEFLDKNIHEYSFESYKHVLKVSQSLQKDVFASIYESVEMCLQKLKMKNTYSLLYYADNESLVEIYPDSNNKLYIILNKDFLSLYSDTERTFILGRYFGHYLCNHLIMPFSLILEKSQRQLSPQHILLAYEWSLYTEITADRFGLVCSDDKNAGFSFLFKNQYSLQHDLFAKNWSDCLMKWDYNSYPQDAHYRCQWLLGNFFHPARFQLLNLDFNVQNFYKNFNYQFLFSHLNDDRWMNWQHVLTSTENRPEPLLVQSLVLSLIETPHLFLPEEKIQILVELTLVLKTLDMDFSKEAYQLALAFEIPSEYIDKIFSFV